MPVGHLQLTVLYADEDEIMGDIYLYYGTGGGKTTNALGLALRSVGHNHKVVIIQFMKWWKEVGEYKIKDRLMPYYEIYQFGRPGWMQFKGEEKKVQVGGVSLPVRQIDDSDRVLAKTALDFAFKTMQKTKPHLLILDEICLAVHSGLLSVEEVLGLLNHASAGTDIVITGRYASRELIDRADFVNEIVDIKSPDIFITKEGIQY
ncbi:MAG: cob(I)yrinic acid a,c-diamide adenosyltransferase [Candidatus Bathyarchaeota archaeon]